MQNRVFLRIALSLSFLLLHTIAGIREGTVISALLWGLPERLFTPLWTVFDRRLSLEP